MNYRNKWLSSICGITLVMGLASCADGFESDEKFTAGGGVTNAQLEAPQITSESLKVQINADGSESVDVSWPVVMGAGGYLANVIDVTDPENDVYIMKDSIIDGCHFSFPRYVDTKYEISVSTLGNEKLNNKGSVDATVLAYTTMLPATMIPEGVELSEFFAQNLQEGAEGEVAFELEGGKTYNLTGAANCQLANVTVRGNKANRPILVISAEGEFVTQAGFTLKYVNVDMSDAPKGKALVSMSNTPNAKFDITNTYAEATKKGYVCPGAIVFEACNMRNIPSSIFMGGVNPVAWAITNFRIEDCVMQINKQDSNAFIAMDGSWAGIEVVKTLTLKNSTFYNISSVTKARFLRVGSRAKATDVFGPGAVMTHTMESCTFYRTFPSDKFANNLVGPETVVNSCILFDINRPDKWFKGESGGKVTSDKNNVAWGAGDDNGTVQDMRNEVKEIATIEDPNFKGPVDQMFNLDLDLGGVSFDPQLQLCHEKKIGDPRWLE